MYYVSLDLISKNFICSIDLGVGVPFPEPIPLHNLPYIHRAVGHRLMYRKSVNDLYECVQLDGSLRGVEYVSSFYDLNEECVVQNR